jgi:hypothetical protein
MTVEEFEDSEESDSRSKALFFQRREAVPSPYGLSREETRLIVEVE